MKHLALILGAGLLHADVLPPKADLQGDAAPKMANRPFTLTLELSNPGTQGVLAAKGGHLHG